MATLPAAQFQDIMGYSLKLVRHKVGFYVISMIKVVRHLPFNCYLSARNNVTSVKPDPGNKV